MAAPSTVAVYFSLQILLQLFHEGRSSTHWVVTEHGRVQSQVDSVFNMKRPDDLVSLLKQDGRASMLDSLKVDLLRKKEEIDKNEDKDTGLEQRFYKKDLDCISAGKPLPDFDLYISTVLPLENKGIRPEEHIDFKAPHANMPIPPYCTGITPMDYSIHAFEHLEGMRERKNLTGTPELGLKNAITHRDNVDDYGQLIYEALRKNKTSWVLYNMAAFYWRIKGDSYHVIECLRRALHYSPRSQKDVALISLANVLHRARYSNEAAIVVHAALDVSKELNVNHFTLGNIYAVLGEYNKSVICFENTLKIQPDFDAARKRKHAVLCHSKLEAALEAQHRSLQRTLNELKDYQKKHEYWQQQSERLLSEQASNDEKSEIRVGYEGLKLRQRLNGAGEKCKIVEREGRQVLKCSLERWHPMEGIDELEKAFRDKEKAKEIAKRPKNLPNPKVNYSQPVRPAVYTMKNNPKEKGHPATIPYTMPDWPTKIECDFSVIRFPAWNEFTTVYLSAENKGFEEKGLLAEAQGLKEGMEHILPWYPPVCVTLSDIDEGPKAYDHYEAVRQRTKVPLKLNDNIVREELMSLVNKGEKVEVAEEEIGQRILTAIKEKIGPDWVLYNLAGLYWRVIGNNYHGIECIRRALVNVPDKYKDVPLVNLANILYKWGRVDEAVKLMREALAINDLEPKTHFFLGNLLSAKGNLTGAEFHYIEALKQDRKLDEAFSNLRVIRCYQKFHQAHQSAAPKEVPAPIATSTNCQKGVAQPTNSQTESRVVCKTENGKETCIVETRTRTKAECQGMCTQTCTITPIKVENCEGEVIGPRADATAGQRAVDNESNVGKCAHVGPSTPQSNLQTKPGPLMDAEFGVKLDEISEHYRKHGVCKGDECNRFFMQCSSPVLQPSGQMVPMITHEQYLVRPQGCQAKNCLVRNSPRPHIRLENINGILHQKLIFVDTPSDIVVNPSDCVIFNDGSKSMGCARDEYKSYEEEVEQLALFHKDFTEFEKRVKEQGGRTGPCQGNQENTDTADDSENDTNFVPGNTARQAEAKQKKEAKKEKIRKHTLFKAVPVETVNHIAKDISDSELPDTTKHIGPRLLLSWPSWEECKTHRRIDFRRFPSTFLSVTAKIINLREHIDFTSKVRGEWKEPICHVMGPSQHTMDHLLGVSERKDLKYRPERALKDVLQKLGGEPEPAEVVATRIATGLVKNATSWVLANLGALYWRVEGDAAKAIDCLRLALHTAPRNMKDISLVSLANVLHKAGRYNDAIVVTNAALEISPKLVVVHFTMANIYAAKEDWLRAAAFYESTLGLQAAFEPAKERLRTIQCKKVLANPEMYAPKSSGDENGQ